MVAVRLLLSLAATLVAFQLTFEVTAKDHVILMSAWFTRGDDLLRNDDIYSSSLFFPLAIQHFNDKRVDVIPDLSRYLSCNVTLKFVNNRMVDSEGMPNVAMGQFIQQFSSQTFDSVVVTRSEVSFLEMLVRIAFD